MILQDINVLLMRISKLEAAKRLHEANKDFDRILMIDELTLTLSCLNPHIIDLINSEITQTRKDLADMERGEQVL